MKKPNGKLYGYALALMVAMLCMVSATALAARYEGEKQSVQALTDGQQVLIYRSVYNAAENKYVDYVINGNGQLERAYDKGNALALYENTSPVWEVEFHRDAVTGKLNGYYDFYNAATGMYLCPRGDGTLVASSKPGVTLNGRRDGAYTSTIESWDPGTWAWWGYHVAGVDTGNIQLEAGKDDKSQAFSFAALTAFEPNVLHPVGTVDSTAAGITIRMFDYPNRDAISNVTGVSKYAGEYQLEATHVANTLSAAGYPYFTKTRMDGSALFSPSSTYYKGTANHLFLASVFNSTAYYEYSAFNNFAKYDASSGQFTVYQEIGTPRGNDSKRRFFFQRGNFYPFNELDPSRPASYGNSYDGSGVALGNDNPYNGSTLYNLKGVNAGSGSGTNYHFGMTVEATFMQSKNGEQDGNPVVYEFNGDDDMWVFIDGVLMLDIGGIHDAWPGTINFQTGQISSTNGGAGGATTIKQAFRNAGRFPDGTAWDDSKVDQYFKGETFLDYSSHSFKMFYMEHGEGASNLEMRFNLPVIEKGKVAVEKDLQNTDQERYANVAFAYQAFRAAGDNPNPYQDELMDGAVYEDTKEPLDFYDNVTINGKTYSRVFYLKPGEAAVFPEMEETTKYWVREIGIGSDYYDEVHVNDVKIDGQEVTPTDGVYPTAVATVGNRARVVYANQCADTNKNDLLITKRLAEGCKADKETFEFRVMLENANGDLVPYSTGPYMLRNDAGEYFHYVGGQLESNGLTPIVASVSGNNGTIAGIPADYTVVISGLLAGTDFHVEEIRNPDGYLFDSKTVTDCDPSELTGIGFDNSPVTADGQIVIGKDAHVVVVNKEVEAQTTVSGTKILKGRDMAAEEFVFVMEPIDVDGKLLSEPEAVQAQNTAGRVNEETHFTFPELTFRYHDFSQAEYRDAEGRALYYFVIREQLSEDADEAGFDPKTQIYYDLTQYLVVVRLNWVDDETTGEKKLVVETDAHAYDGHGVPEDLLPAPGTRLVVARGM